MKLREIRERGPEPGTQAFSELAKARKQRLREGGRRPDLSAKNARKTVSAATAEKNKYLAGD